MKKLLTIIIILATFSLCTSDVFIEEPQVVVPNKSLHIEGVEGLKLQRLHSNFRYQNKQQIT
jgi:hypothetical protein